MFEITRPPHPVAVGTKVSVIHHDVCLDLLEMFAASREASCPALNSVGFDQHWLADCNRALSTLLRRTKETPPWNRRNASANSATTICRITPYATWAAQYFGTSMIAPSMADLALRLDDLVGQFNNAISNNAGTKSELISWCHEMVRIVRYGNDTSYAFLSNGRQRF